VARSTLADANEARDWRIFADFAHRLIATARGLYVREPMGVDLDESLHALDSTTIDLCLALFPWARFRRHKAAIKMHTLLDLWGNIPTFIRVTDGKVHDVNLLDEIMPEAGAFYVMDRGYIDFERLKALALAFTALVVVPHDRIAATRRCRDVVLTQKLITDGIAIDLGRRGRRIIHDVYIAADVVVHKNARSGILIAQEIATDHAGGSKASKSRSRWEVAECPRFPTAILNLNIPANYCRIEGPGVERYKGTVVSLKVATNCPLIFERETSVFADRNIAAHRSTALQHACRVVRHDKVAFDRHRRQNSRVAVCIRGQSGRRGCQQRTEHQRHYGKAFHIFLLWKLRYKCSAPLRTRQMGAVFEVRVRANRARASCGVCPWWSPRCGRS